MAIICQEKKIFILIRWIKFPQRKFLFENLHESSTTRKSTSGPSGLKIKGCISNTHNKDIMIFFFSNLCALCGKLAKLKYKHLVSNGNKKDL